MPQVRFLIEIGVGKKAENAIAGLGYDVKTLRSIVSRLTDSEILALAAKEERIVVTMDKDFGELVYRSNERSAGVLLLRMEDATGNEKANVLTDIIVNHGEELAGRFSVFQGGILRIR